MFSYNLNNENDFLKGVKKENRIFCMILTQNKSLYNNRVNHSLFYFSEKYY